MLKPPSQRRWVFREYDPSGVECLRSSGLPEPLLPLFLQRGIIEVEDLERFLDPRLATLPDPFLLGGMEAGAERVATAVMGGERVCIHGDYDVDGITGSALLVSFLRELGTDVFFHIPHRIDDGYGLSSEGLGTVAAQGATLVVTVDCGISALEPARRARELGVDLIVTDHHLPGDELPDALALIDPAIADSRFPSKNLAGVGVAFFLAVAVRSTLRRQGFFARHPEPDLRKYLGLVALGTIADLVPITGINRPLVRYGLDLLSRSDRPGISALKKVAGVTGAVTCSAVGFRLAPRLNAAGRLDHAASGLELLLTEDPARADKLAQDLDQANRERQVLEHRILSNALEMLSLTPLPGEARSIVLASSDWHPGVIGIVASRVAELYHRPTILISLRDGVGKGSCRSIPALHLRDALDACSSHLLAFGGHRQAAGLTVDEETLASFIERFEEVASGMLSEEDLVPVLTIDLELVPHLCSEDAVSFLRRMAPFGIGNPEPLFLVRGAELLRSHQLNGGHLRCTFGWSGKRLEGVWFAPRDMGLRSGEVVDIAANLTCGEWRGIRSISLRIRDIRRSGHEA